LREELEFENKFDSKKCVWADFVFIDQKNIITNVQAKNSIVHFPIRQRGKYKQANLL
jgi:hypothetical protein